MQTTAATKTTPQKPQPSQATDVKARLRAAMARRKRRHEARGAEVLHFARQQAVADLRALEAAAIGAHDFEPLIEAVDVPHAAPLYED